MNTFNVGHWPNSDVWFVRCEHADGSASTRSMGTETEAHAAYARLIAGDRCRECGDPREFGHYAIATQRRLDAEHLCVTCLFWTEQIKQQDVSCVVGGYAYTIEPDPPAGFRGSVGHGGAQFTIRYLDGRTVVSRNLWARGMVPAHFRDRLPDNAVFVSENRRTLTGMPYSGSGSAMGAAPPPVAIQDRARVPRPSLRCQGCGKGPSELDEYCDAAQEDGLTPDEYCWREEGTLDTANGHFLCTSCYVTRGMPATTKGWVCP